MKASKPTFFISAPLAMDWTKILHCEKHLERQGIAVEYWDRKSAYQQEDFDRCDAVVFLLPDNAFKGSPATLPVGLRSELSRAYATAKKVFVGYTNKSGQFQIYRAVTNGKDIQGVAETYNDYLEFARTLVASTKKNEEFMSTNPCGGIPLEGEFSPKKSLTARYATKWEAVAGNFQEPRLLLML